MSEGNAPAISSPVEYIQHHLQNGSIGGKPESLVDFGVFFWDIFAVTVVLAGLLAFVSWKVGQNLDPDKPTGIQNVLESIVEFVNQQVQDIHHLH